MKQLKIRSSFFTFRQNKSKLSSHMLILLLTLQTFFSLDLSEKLSANSIDINILALNEHELIIWEKAETDILVYNIRSKKIKEFNLSQENTSTIAAITVSSDQQIYVYHDFSENISVFNRQFDFLYKFPIPEDLSAISSLAINSRKQLFILDSDEAKLKLYNIQQLKTEAIISNASVYKLALKLPSKVYLENKELSIIDANTVHYFSDLGVYLFSSAYKDEIKRNLNINDNRYLLSKNGTLNLNGKAIASSVDDFVILNNQIYLIREKRYLERLR